MYIYIVSIFPWNKIPYGFHLGPAGPLGIPQADSRSLRSRDLRPGIAPLRRRRRWSFPARHGGTPQMNGTPQQGVEHTMMILVVINVYIYI